MLISELEAKLKAIKEEHGDCEVAINTNYDMLWKNIDSVIMKTNHQYYPTVYESKVLMFE